MSTVDASEAAVSALRLSPRVIAIDGPAGSGKTTVGFAVADCIDYLFFDTGAMYRAVTWTAIARNIDVTDEAAITTLADAIVIDIQPPPASQQQAHASIVIVDGEDVTDYIRLRQVDRDVSTVSAYAGVRNALSLKQKAIGKTYGLGSAGRAGIVMVGRDIGTVIMPDAPIKLFLDASAAERANRRYRELKAQGKTTTFEEVLASIRKRDEVDTRRALSPLRAADDATIIDTSEMHVNEVVETVLKLIVGRAGTGSGDSND